MAQHHERALVLDIKDYRETSSLVRLFTEHEGRISLVARGLRKSKGAQGASVLQPFNVVQAKFYLKEGASIGTLAGADLEQSASAPHGSLESYAVVSLWFEILRETTQERTSLAAVFQLTTRMLRSQEDRPGLTLDFLAEVVRLCDQLGFGITLGQCVICDAKIRGALDHISISRGGAVCDACANSGHSALTLHPGEAAIAHLLIHQPHHPPDPPPSPADLLGFLGIIHRFLVYHLEHPLKTIRFVNDTCS